MSPNLEDLSRTKSLWIGLVIIFAIFAISFGLGVSDLKNWTSIGAIILASAIISYWAAKKEMASTDDDSSDFSTSDILMVVIAMIAILFALAFHGQKADFLIISLAGIIGLSVPLVLALSSKVNLGSRLDSGEIRKAIVISLTIVYIILLVISFNSTFILGSKDSTTSAASSSVSIHEKLTRNNSVEREHNFTFNLNNTNGGFEATNASGFTFKFTPLIINGSSGKISLGNSTGGNVDVIPENALSNFTNNFLYVYAVIILFYFGSRAWENNKTDNSVKDYLMNLINPTKGSPGNQNDHGKPGDLVETTNPSPTPLKAEDIVSLRYALGDIGDREYKSMMGNLVRIAGGIRILDVNFATSVSNREAKINVFNANKKIDVTLEEVAIERKDNGKNIVDPEFKEQLDRQYRRVAASEKKEITIKITELVWDTVYHIKVATDITGDTDEGNYKVDTEGDNKGKTYRI